MLFRFFVVVVGFVFVAPLAAQTEQEKQDRFNVLLKDNTARLSGIRDLCAGDWPADFAMQEYCQKKHREGYTNLIKIWPEVLPKIGHAAVQCVFDWSEDLVFDWRMIHYCVNRQYTAWKSLQP